MASPKPKPVAQAHSKPPKAMPKAGHPGHSHGGPTKPRGGIGTPATGKPTRVGGPPGYLSPPRRPNANATGGRPGDEFRRKPPNAAKPAAKLTKSTTSRPTHRGAR